MHSGPKNEANGGTKIEAHSAPKMEAQSWRSNVLCANLVKEYENQTPLKLKYELKI